MNSPECKTVFQGIVEQNSARTERSRVRLQLQQIVLLCSNLSSIYESFHKREYLEGKNYITCADWTIKDLIELGQKIEKIFHEYALEVFFVIVAALRFLLLL